MVVRQSTVSWAAIVSLVLGSALSTSVSAAAAAGSWTFGYTCTTDALNIYATAPAPGLYKVNTLSPESNSQADVASISVADGQASVEQDIPMAVVHAAGVPDSAKLEVNLINAGNNEVVGGTVVNTTETACVPAPTPTDTVEPTPTFWPSPIPSPITPLMQQQSARWLKEKKLRVGKKYKLPASTRQGTPTEWAARGRNSKDERVCREVITATKTNKKKYYAKALHKGKCTLTVFADAKPGLDALIQQKRYRVVGRQK